VVAARRDMIDRLLEATRIAGLRVQGIDLSAFAMIRALHRPGSSEAVLYVNVGGVTNLAVAEGATCAFTRVLAYGSETMAGELAERRGLNLEHAHGWLKHVGLLAPLHDLDGEREIVLEARNVLSEGLKRLGDEVRNSLDFHTMQPGAEPVQRTVLSGPALAVPGFAEQLGMEIGLPLEPVTVSEAQPGGFGDVEAGSLAVAAGLTIDEVPA
jgi:type IV pilus assembly protein PilM